MSVGLDINWFILPEGSVTNVRKRAGGAGGTTN